MMPIELIATVLNKVFISAKKDWVVKTQEVKVNDKLTMFMFVEFEDQTTSGYLTHEEAFEYFNSIKHGGIANIQRPIGTKQHLGMKKDVGGHLKLVVDNTVNVQLGKIS